MLRYQPLDIAAGAWWSRAARALTGFRDESQRALAARLGTSQGHFGQYETGSVTPKMRCAVRWAKALDCRIGVQRGAGDLHELGLVDEWGPVGGRVLAGLRAQAGWSQKRLAAQTGMAVATVQNVEAGGDPSVTTWAAYVFGIGWAPVLVDEDGGYACHTRPMGAGLDGRGMVRCLYGDAGGRWLLVTGAEDREALPSTVDQLVPLGAPSQVIRTVYERACGRGRPPVQAAMATLLGVRQQVISYALVNGADPDLSGAGWATLVRLYHDRDLVAAAVADQVRKAG